MNDKKAKLLRKTVYGPDDYRQREYLTLPHGQVINKPMSLRNIYQGTKKLFKEQHGRDLRVKSK